MKNAIFIGYASGWGAQVRNTEKGPNTIKNSPVLNSWRWKETIYPKKTSLEIDLASGLETLPYIKDTCQRLASSVRDSIKEEYFPVIIGGDHVVAAGTWAGVVSALDAQKKFGLIWIDAHMDSHTMETTPSKALHGMPLAALLGYGEPALVNILDQGPSLDPKQVCLIGIRSYEEGERALLEKLGVRIYYIDEVQSRGFKVVFEEALRIVKQGTKGYGISMDLDGFDPEEAPGVGSPAANGLKSRDVLPEIRKVGRDPNLKAFELVEYNPDRDIDHKTLVLCQDVLQNLLSKKEV